MNWKLCTTVFSSALACLYPVNGIGCASGEEGNDYYTSFFNSHLITAPEYQPFYYTALLRFYDDDPYSGDLKAETTKRAEALRSSVLREWQDYCANKPSLKDVSYLVYQSGTAEINALKDQLSGKAVDAVSPLFKNSMASYLLAQKDVGALNYLLLAKQSEGWSFATTWDGERRDSARIDKDIVRTQTLFGTASNGFLKSRSAFLRCKLAFYNHRFADCINWYYDYFNGKRSDIAEQLAHSYAAGALFRIHRNNEAAYEFSKMFAGSRLDKKTLFQGFLWATNDADPALQDSVLTLAKNDRERAALYGLFGLYGTSYRLSAARKVYQLDPTSSLVPLLVVREIGKLEEKYLSPALGKRSTKNPNDYTWNGSNGEDKKQLDFTLHFVAALAKESKTNQGFYLTAAAYLSFISRDFDGARKYVSAARSVPTDANYQDQLQLINLLIAANEPQKLDAAAEAALLPSLQWLAQKAEKDDAYRIFLRNFATAILGPRYQWQVQYEKVALARGLADKALGATGYAIDFIHDEMSTPQLKRLHDMLNGKGTSPFENFLMQHISFTDAEVVNTIGTSYLRDHDFAQAVNWLQRPTHPDSLVRTDWDEKTQKEITYNVDPFYDYVNDVDRNHKKSPIVYTKLSLARKLLDVQQSIEKTSDREAKARLCYQLASALYNISFYGNSYMAVDYYRHSSTWNRGRYDAPWQKEYYTVNTARSYYQKAFDLSSNKEFKAACFFLIIKCAQRQIVAPDEYDYTDIDVNGAHTAFWHQFKYNPLFGQFKKDFGDTKYFNYVRTRCSYLRDFVNRR